MSHFKQKFTLALFSIVLLVAGILISHLFFQFLYNSTLTFESLESKTETNEKVINKISFIQKEKTDYWYMKQSHDNGKSWDSLAITVQEIENKKLSKFYQIDPNANIDSSLSHQIKYKVNCLACHSNGPRLIRPNYLSASYSLDFKSNLLILILNLRIKTYGRMASVIDENFVAESSQPLKSKLLMESYLNKKIELKSCTLCHSENGIRNSLTYRQIGTIEFLLTNNLMPPFPFKASEKDLNKLKTLY